MTSLTLCFLLLKCQMIVCPSSLHSCVQAEICICLWLKGLLSSPSEHPGEIMSFGVSPVNYSVSDSENFPNTGRMIANARRFDYYFFVRHGI